MQIEDTNKKIWIWCYTNCVDLVSRQNQESAKGIQNIISKPNKVYDRWTFPRGEKQHKKISLTWLWWCPFWVVFCGGESPSAANIIINSQYNSEFTWRIQFPTFFFLRRNPKILRITEIEITPTHKSVIGSSLRIQLHPLIYNFLPLPANNKISVHELYWIEATTHTNTTILISEKTKKKYMSLPKPDK